MQVPARPLDEEFRTMALDGLGILDTGADADFDSIVALGRDLFGVPTCLVSLIDRDRQWFKAKIGLAAEESARDTSFCGHAILAREVMVVPDARKDPRFHDNPFVTGAPFVRFYAGAPIVLPSGYTIGTVCVIAPEPRPAFSGADAARLAVLARLAVDALTVRALRAELDRARAGHDRLRRAVELLAEPLAVVDADGVAVEANAAFAALCEGYFARGASLLEQTAVTRADLERAAADGVHMVGAGDGGPPLRIHPDLDGFVVTLATG